MTIQAFRIKLKEDAKSIQFSETLEVIDSNFNFIPTAFKNGSLINKVGQNSGSCKVFAFAKEESLTEDETLFCFGQYYFDEVLNDPNGTGHQNIRNFIKTGFKGLDFDSSPLVRL